MSVVPLNQAAPWKPDQAVKQRNVGRHRAAEPVATRTTRARWIRHELVLLVRDVGMFVIGLVTGLAVFGLQEIIGR